MFDTEKIAKFAGATWKHGGSMFATFWIVIALYALGGYLVWAFLQLDAEFSRPLAGGVVPEEVTQQIAWGTRAFSVIAGSVAIYFAAHKMRGWQWFFTALTGIAALILLIHAYGVASKIMQGQFDKDASIGTIATIDKGAIQAEIDDLIAERDGLPGLTDSAVATFQRSIDSITNDGLDNDDEAQEFADKQVAAIEARDARLAEIRTELADKRDELRDTSSTEETKKVNSDGFNPLFIFGARLSSGTWSPEEEPPVVHSFVWGVAFFTLFFGFGEVLMMACFTGGYAVLKLRSVQQLEAEAEISEKDPVRVEAGKKAANTRNRRKRQGNLIAVRAETLAPRWRHAVRLARNTAWTTESIQKNAFKGASMEEIISLLQKAEERRNPDEVSEPYITDEEIRLVKRLDKGLPAVQNRNNVDIVAREPNSVNGSGEPIQTEDEGGENADSIESGDIPN